MEGTLKVIRVKTELVFASGHVATAAFSIGQIGCCV